MSESLKDDVMKAAKEVYSGYSNKGFNTPNIVYNINILQNIIPANQKQQNNKVKISIEI